MTSHIDRASFLRLGAVGALAAAGASVATTTAAHAALPPVTPVGDDVGFIQFGAVAERAAHSYYRQALATPGLFDARQRRWLDRARREKREHMDRLNAALGADALTDGDYEIDLPPRAFTSTARALELGEHIEGLLVGVYVYGVAYAADPATRLLLGRLLTSAGQQRSALQIMGGGPPTTGLPGPLDIAAAGDQLDALLSIPGEPS